MTETNGAAGAAQTQQPPKMQMLGQFIRDMSFENIASQKGVTGEVQPDIQVKVDLDARKRPQEHQYEVSIKLNLHSKNKKTSETIFLLELEYAGIFMVENIPDEQVHAFLMIECPRMLFPFLRRIVSDVTHDGGFPPINLDNIDFLALYRAEVSRRAEAMKKEPPAATPS